MRTLHCCEGDNKIGYLRVHAGLVINLLIPKIVASLRAETGSKFGNPRTPCVSSKPYERSNISRFLLGWNKVAPPLVVRQHDLMIGIEFVKENCH